LFFNLGEHLPDDGLRVADDGVMAMYVFADARSVNVDVNEFRAESEFTQCAGHAVVESRADRNQKVAVVDRHIRPIAAMHSEHPQAQRVASRERAQPHQRAGRRQIQFFGEPAKLFASSRRDRAAADIEHRTFGFDHCIDRPPDSLGVAVNLRLVAAHLDAFGVAEFDLLRGHVFRQVYEHRAGPASRGDVKSLLDRRRKFLDVFDQIIVFRAGASNARQIGFLKRVVADQMSRDLPRENNHGQRIHKGVGDARYRVGPAGA
jgi:hypothetical protein